MTEMQELELKKKFFENMEQEDVTKEDLGNFRAFKKPNLEKYSTDKTLLNEIQLEKNFKARYGRLIDDEIEWETGGAYNQPMCACETVIEDLTHWIYNHKDATEGKKINVYRVGSSCVCKFVGLARTCLICGKPYRGINKHCTDQKCKEECDKKRTEDNKKYLATLCIVCNKRPVNVEKYKNKTCYECNSKRKSQQHPCEDCKRMCSTAYVRCYPCNIIFNK